MPLTDSYGQGIPFPTLTDKPNAQTLGQGIVEGLTPRSVMSFASAVVRGGTIKKPVAGMLSYIEDVARWEGFDGESWVTLGSGTSAWKTPVLANGYTDNGNDNGPLRYRRVNLFGEVSVMWQGGLNLTYSVATKTLPNGGVIVDQTLPVDYRPSHRRTVTAACSGVDSNTLSLKIDFNTDGTVAIVRSAGANPPWVSLNNVMYQL